MGKCLVTKLNGAVNDDSLLSIGELRIKIEKVTTPTSTTQLIKIGVTTDTILKIVGNGYFTDSTLNQNKGKSITIGRNDESPNDVYVSNGDFELAIMNKYNLTMIICGSFQNKELFLDDLKFSTSVKSIEFSPGNVYGDLDTVKSMSNLQSLSLNNTGITGDIAALSDKNIGVMGLQNTTAFGDISNIAASKSLSYLLINGTGIKGDISVLKDKVNLKYLNISNTGLYGDISAFKNLTKIKELLLNGLDCTGDLAALPDNILFVDCSKNIGKFSWGSSSRKYIMAMYKIVTDDVDKILNAMSNMEAKFLDSYVWYHSIELIGTRTSASDSAVATLQSKGYTVSVTPAS